MALLAALPERTAALAAEWVLTSASSNHGRAGTRSRHLKGARRLTFYLRPVKVIVAGRLYLRPGTRERFLALSADAMAQARGAPGCRDFVVAADPLEADRVNVYEAWASREALAAFRGAGPGDDLSALIVRAEVAEHVVIPAARP